MSLFLDQKSDQLVLGFTLLIVGIGLMPFMAGLLASMTVKMNLWVQGSLYDWQEAAISGTKIFFAAMCAFVAAYGAVLLALTATVSAGLIKNPWE